MNVYDLVNRPISGEWGSGDGEVAVIRTTNFTNSGFLDFRSVVRRDISKDKVQKKRLKSGDTIIEKSGGSPAQPVGRVVYFNVDGVFLCNNFTSVLRPLDEQVDPKYFFWFMFASYQFGKSRSFQNKTTGIINLKLDNYLRSLQIPLPPLETQRAIAAKLDAADRLRQLDQQLLTKYDELAQALFIDLFGDPVKNDKGWEVVKLSSLFSSLKAGVSVNSVSNTFDANRPCVLKTSCVSYGRFEPAEAKIIEPDELVRAKVSPIKDSIIISRMNTENLVGVSAYVDANYPNLYLPDRLWMAEKSSLEYSSMWLAYAMKQEGFMNRIRSIASGTSGSMKNISKAEFLRIPIIFPELEAQMKFENGLRSLFEQRKRVPINCSTKLFNTLLGTSFS